MSGLSLSSPSSSYSPGTLKSWVDGDGTLHEWYRVLVFIGREFLGEFQLDPGDHPELGYRRTGVAYYCWHCGEVWARLVFIDSAGRRSPLNVEQISCEKHYDQWQIAGSLLGARLEGILPYLPAAAVKREFRIYLQQEVSDVSEDR